MEKEIKNLLVGISKVNMGAKMHQKQKEVEYKERNHDMVRQHKIMQNTLYTLKALTIIDLINKGVLSKTGKQQDKNGNVLNVIQCDTFKFHTISSTQEMCEDLEIYQSIYNQKSVTYMPYFTFLVNQLSPELKEVFQTLQSENFYLYGEEGVRLLNKLNKLNMLIEWKEIRLPYGWFTKRRGYLMQISYNDIKICDFTVSLFEENILEYNDSDNNFTITCAPCEIDWID